MEEHNMEPYVSDYSFTDLKELSNYIHLNITHMFHAAVDRNWKNENRCDNINRLYFILDGSGYVYAGGERTKLRPGNAYLIPANICYSYGCDDYMEKLFIHFSLNIIPQKELLSEIGQIIEIKMTVHEIEDMEKIFHNQNITSSLFLKGYLYQMLFKAVSLSDVQIERDICLFKKYQKLYTYITNNLYADTRVAQICQNTGYSQRHISYSFKKDMGQTIKEYITQLLLDEIKHLLIFTDMPIKNISSKLHFTDEFYCSRYFKKHMGISPRDYREMHKNDIV